MGYAGLRTLEMQEQISGNAYDKLIIDEAAEFRYSTPLAKVLVRMHIAGDAQATEAMKLGPDQREAMQRRVMHGKVRTPFLDRLRSQLVLARMTE